MKIIEKNKLTYRVLHLKTNQKEKSYRNRTTKTIDIMRYNNNNNSKK